MCASREHPLLQKLGLSAASHFRYTNQGEALEIPGVDDAAEFRATVQAFSLLHIDEQKQAELFRVLAGVLFLGNLDFLAQGEKSELDVSLLQLVRMSLDQSAGLF